MTEELFQIEYKLHETVGCNSLCLSVTSDKDLWPEWGQSVDLSIADDRYQNLFELTPAQAIQLAKNLIEFARIVSGNNNSSNNSGEV